WRQGKSWSEGDVVSHAGRRVYVEDDSGITRASVRHSRGWRAIVRATQDERSDGRRDRAGELDRVQRVRRRRTAAAALVRDARTRQASVAAAELADVPRDCRWNACRRAEERWRSGLVERAQRR